MTRLKVSIWNVAERAQVLPTIVSLNVNNSGYIRKETREAALAVVGAGPKTVGLIASHPAKSPASVVSSTSLHSHLRFIDVDRPGDMTRAIRYRVVLVIDTWPALSRQLRAAIRSLIVSRVPRSDDERWIQ
jgi:hypothetical protein